MHGYIVLCDFAEQDLSGKIHMIGGGWSMTGPAPHPHGVVFFLKLSSSRLKSPVPVKLSLTDSQRQVVEVPGPAGPQRMEIEGQVAPLGLRQPEDDDMEMDVALTVNVSALQLAPGRYTWTAEVDGKDVTSTQFIVTTASITRAI